MSLQRPKTLEAALLVVSDEVPVSDDTAQGHFLGMVIGMVAVGMTEDEALGHIRQHLPADARWQRIPIQYRTRMGFTGAKERVEDL